MPLTLWFLVALVRLPLSDYAAVSIWAGSGWNPLWLALLLLSLCWHSRAGVQVVIEDYVHAPALKIGSLLLNSGEGKTYRQFPGDSLIPRWRSDYLDGH